MAIIRQDDSKYTVELTGDDLEEYLKMRFPKEVKPKPKPKTFLQKLWKKEGE